jgi:hypothetical protein
MTDEEKSRLVNRFLDRTITDAERKSLSDQVEADDDLAARLRFHLSLRTSNQRAYSNALEANYRQQSSVSTAPALRRPLLILGLMILVALLVYLILANRDRLPFTPEEGRELLEEAIAYEENVTQQIGVVAGPASWENLLLNDEARPESYRRALSELESRIDQVGRCENARYEYFSGLLQLYFRRDPNLASAHFECLAQSGDGRFAAQSVTPRILLLVSEGRLEEARALYTDATYDPVGLPRAVRRQLELPAG